MPACACILCVKERFWRLCYAGEVTEHMGSRKGFVQDRLDMCHDRHVFRELGIMIKMCVCVYILLLRVI